LGGQKYSLLAVDQYTSIKWSSFFLKSKDEQPQVLTNVVKEISQQVKIEHWEFDDARENKTPQDMFQENGFSIK
jgi:hypothetical protein